MKYIKYMMLLIIGISILCACQSKEVVANQKEEEILEESSITTTDEVKESQAVSSYKEKNPDTSQKEEIPQIQYKTILENNFESDLVGFKARGNATITLYSQDAYEGEKCLQVTGRSETWNGITIDMTSTMIEGKMFHISAWVKYEEGAATQRIDCKIQKNGNEYLDFGTTVAKKGEWTFLEGDIKMPAGLNSVEVYFETPWKGDPGTDDLIDFYVDNVQIVEVVVEGGAQIMPSLKEIYKEDFSIGMALSNYGMSYENQLEVIVEQFNSLTCENEMKPDALLDYETCISDPKYDTEPAIDFTRAKKILDFAQKNGMKMRGHTLVWHSQTPRWFFAEGYSKNEDAPLVSKEVMLKRMENYIKSVLTYTQTNYPGLVYAWDVVNEAINPEDGVDKGYRKNKSLWYQVIGEEFVEKAFEYARKYADPEVKLFYNDYNTYEITKRIHIYNMAKALKEKGLIDGIGMQSHIHMDYPSLIDYEDTILKFADLDVEIQITELDMNLKSNIEEDLIKQGERYEKVFNLIKKLKREGRANITNITFWGLQDNFSWLNSDGPNYPLLFDKYLQAKPAFWGVLGSEGDR